MWKISNNFRCYVTEDGQHFAIENIPASSVGGAYRLGKFVEVKDGSKKYLVTIDGNQIFHRQEIN